jgi:hypothetical protein
VVVVAWTAAESRESQRIQTRNMKPESQVNSELATTDSESSIRKNQEKNKEYLSKSTRKKATQSLVIIKAHAIKTRSSTTTGPLNMEKTVLFPDRKDAKKGSETNPDSPFLRDKSSLPILFSSAYFQPYRQWLNLLSPFFHHLIVDDQELPLP